MVDEHSFGVDRGRDQLVHIVDPDPLTCEALSVLFRLEGFQTAFSVALPDFIASLQYRLPDVVVANFDLGRDDGLALLHRLRMLDTRVAVFLIENQPMVEAAVAAIKAGASDVVTKPINSDRLLRAVREALRNDIPGGPAATRHVAVEIRGFSHLTPREREVLELITRGQSNKEAGRELGISPRTIEVHRARVMEKLGARNTADLMRIVLAR